MSRGKAFAVICFVVAGMVFFLSQNKKLLSVDSAANSEASDESSTGSSNEGVPINPAQHESEKVAAASFEPRTGAMQPRRIRQPQQIRQSGSLKKLKKELQPSLLFAESHWKLWQGIRAISAAEAPVAPANYLANVSGYFLVEDNEFAAQENFVGQAEPLIYYNQRTQQAGVVTGTLKITLRNSGNIESVNSRYSLKLEGAFPHLNLYMVRSSHEPVDLQFLQKQLQADADIAQVEVEILSRQYEKN